MATKTVLERPTKQEIITITIPKTKLLQTLDIAEKQVEQLAFLANAIIGGSGSIAGYDDGDWCGNGPRPGRPGWIRMEFAEVKQVVVAEKEVATHLSQGWAFKTQLANGEVILEQTTSLTQSAATVRSQIKQQLLAGLNVIDLVSSSQDPIPIIP